MQRGQGVIILIADSNAVRRRGLRRLLDDEGASRLVEVDGRAQDLTRAVEEHQADVVVVSLALDGAELIELVDAAGAAVAPAPGVVVVSGRRDFAHVRAALRAGALGFVLREDALAELPHATRAAMDRQRWLSPSLGAALLVEGDTADPADTLSEREVEVLRLLALGHTNAEVAARLYLSVRTIENHRASLVRKLHAAGRADLVRAALERGLLDDAVRSDRSVIA